VHALSHVADPRFELRFTLLTRHGEGARCRSADPHRKCSTATVDALVRRRSGASADSTAEQR
jgi:hypothetical protein